MGKDKWGDREKIMTQQLEKSSLRQKDFVAWYRRFFSGEKDLPCLQCPDSRIIACSKVELERNPNAGCIGFRIYVGKKGG